MESFVYKSPHLSTTTSSIVPYFSSTIAPYVPLHASLSTTVTPNVLQTKSIVAPTVTSENIQDLVDQLKTCIATLSLFFPNKEKHGKRIISNGKPYSDEKVNRAKNKQPQSLWTSTPARLRFSRSSTFNENIPVRQCNHSYHHE